MRIYVRKLLRFVRNLVVGSKAKRDVVLAPHLNATVSQQPGLNCPKCAFKIPITIPMLLSGQPVYCTNCFLKLEVDQEKSGESISVLQKLQESFDTANEIIRKETS